MENRKKLAKMIRNDVDKATKCILYQQKNMANKWKLVKRSRISWVNFGTKTRQFSKQSINIYVVPNSREYLS